MKPASAIFRPAVMYAQGESWEGALEGVGLDMIPAIKRSVGKVRRGKTLVLNSWHCWQVYI